MRIAGIIRESYVDGPGVRTVIFLQGCPLNCHGCHNPDTHDPEGGSEMTDEEIAREIASLPHCEGVTLSGGEPFSQPEAVAALCRRLKGLDKHLMVYSGFTYEQLLKRAETEESVRDVLGHCDVLVDGPYVAAQRDISLAFRGSRNQRIIDLPCSLEKGEIIVLDWDSK